MRRNTFIGTAVVAILLVIGIVFIAFAARDTGPGTTAQSTGSRERGAVATAGTSGATASPSSDGGQVVTTRLFRTIAKRENPVVVAITTQAKRTAPAFSGESGPDDFFRQFFGGAAPRPQVERALGSGFLISPDGDILTNNHVVAGADEIRVGLFGKDNRDYKADVVGRDPLTDTALIKLKDGPGNLPTATLGDSSSLEPGDWVMAIGNPFQLGHTVTVGVISYSGRPFATTEGRFQNMLQTDASINPGNSGGPLIDTDGNVVGINSAILSGEGGGGNIGIGFAVPINTVKDLLPQLRQGRVHRGQLGVQILTAPMTDEEAKSLGLPGPGGAVISRVEPDSPADHAGLRAGDVIVEFNGQRIKDASQLTSLVVATRGGTQVPVTYFRNGQRRTATVTVQELQLDEENGQGGEGGGDHGTASGFGLTLGNVTPDVAQQLRLPANVHGAVVEDVEPFTPASTAGVKPGDVIVEVNRQPVQSSRDAIRLLRSIRSGGAAFLLINRGGTEVFVEMQKE